METFLMATAVFTPNKTSFAIMKLVHGYFSKTKKSWTLMDQMWMLDKLAKWHHIKIARSTLSYNLKILREQGILETVTRHQRDPQTGAFVCRITLYKMTGKLKRYFSNIAAYFARCGWIPSVKQLKAGILPVLGTATSREEALREYLLIKKEMKKKGKGG
jgi:DNA-binding transcriptional ArsR family regulator